MRKDLPALLRLCKEHALFEKADYDELNKVEALDFHLFGSENPIQCIVAVLDEELFGYAIAIKQFSTWSAAYYLYVDCLFLKKEIRGTGIGSKFMSILGARAKKETCQWMEWQTPIFNEQAIGFYKNLGAVSKTKKRFFLDLK